MTRRNATARLLTAVGVLLAAAVSIAGCSVSTNEEPSAAGNLFATFLEATTTTTSTSTPDEDQKTEPLYFLETTGATRLKFAERQFKLGDPLEAVLSSLFTLPPDHDGTERPDETGLSSAIPESAVLGEVAPAPDDPTELRIEVTGLFGAGGSEGSTLRNALAQIVWTATESPDVSSVTFWTDGERKPAIVGNGQTVDGPVDRRNYTRLG